MEWWITDYPNDSILATEEVSCTRQTIIKCYYNTAILYKPNIT